MWDGSCAWLDLTCWILSWNLSISIKRLLCHHTCLPHSFIPKQPVHVSLCVKLINICWRLCHLVITIFRSVVCNYIYNELDFCVILLPSYVCWIFTMSSAVLLFFFPHLPLSLGSRHSFPSAPSQYNPEDINPDPYVTTLHTSGYDSVFASAGEPAGDDIIITMSICLSCGIVQVNEGFGSCVDTIPVKSSLLWTLVRKCFIHNYEFYSNFDTLLYAGPAHYQ